MTKGRQAGKERIRQIDRDTHELRAELLGMEATGAKAATEVARRAPIAKENFIVGNIKKMCRN